MTTQPPSPRPRRQASLWQQLRHLSWPELRHQPWRNLTALLAVVLGVALAFSVHLINESALSEFSAAVRSVNGQADFELRAQREGFDEMLYDRVSRHPGVAVASPVIDIDTLAMNESRSRIRVLGLDALVAPLLNPDLLPHPDPGADRLVMLAPDAAFPNDTARRQLGLPAAEGTVFHLQQGLEAVPLHARGRVTLPGEAVVVMDIAGVQTRFGWLGRLSRIDVRLQPGADRAQVLRELDLPPGVHAVDPQDAAQRVSNLSRAYRVNLTVLALVALFTGSFLVFSVLSLSVARRTPQFALLGVLGLGARERLRLVLAESALLGLAGSALGLLLGTALAAAALRLLEGDLGGGYFPGVTPTLRFQTWAALLYGALGVAAALLGGWLPARMAKALAPAQALKGLGGHAPSTRLPWAGPGLLALGALLAAAPPVGGVPLAAYVSVACLLLGGIACVPAGVAWLLDTAGTRQAPWLQRRPLVLLATARARHQRHSATIAVAGVVASLALSVALTVMVASFRHAVIDWLDTVLPADLYVRTSVNAASDNVFLPPELVRAVAQLPGVARLETQRVLHLQLDPARPGVTLLARPLPDPARDLPLVEPPLPPLPGEVNVYVSEAMASLHGAHPGQALTLPLPPRQPALRVQVRGVWRDYARQNGSVMMAADDFERLTGDTRVNDLALWLRPGASAAEVRQGILDAARPGRPADPLLGELLEFDSPGEIRVKSLRIFDRSFAVTYWLQAVAIGIGLFGVAASFSAQVLARRKEFGLLTHLGLTRRQILALVAGEGAVWSATGAALGLALGLAVSVVLVKVVNPQSFHWTMDLAPPWPRLALLCLTVWTAGTLTAWLSAWRVGARDAAKSVKEDW